MIGGFNKLRNLPSAVLWSVLAVVIVGVGVGGFFLFNDYIYDEKQGGGDLVVRDQVHENSSQNANAAINNNTELPKANVVGLISPQNGAGYVPEGWQEISLKDLEDSAQRPYNNLNDQISEAVDSLVNTYTNERYFVEREEGATNCGPNGGTSTCNLVREKQDGSTEVVEDLWFPKPGETSDGEDYIFKKHGARLLSFTDATTLQLLFGEQDHGGGFLEASSYSLTNKSLESKVLYVQSEGSDLGDYTILSYSVRKRDAILLFQNGNTDYIDGVRTELLPGVYFFSAEGTISLLDTPAGPYSVEFNIVSNIDGDNIIFKVNSVVMKVNMSTGEFEYINFEKELLNEQIGGVVEETTIGGDASNQLDNSVDTSAIYLDNVDVPEDWLTYTHEIYRYSFKYPPEWTVYIPYYRYTPPYQDDTVYVVPDDAPQPGSNVSEDLFIGTGERVFSEKYLLNKRNLVINGNKAIQAMSSTGNFESGPYTYFQSGNRLFRFLWDKKYQGKYPEYEKILSTFEFDYNTENEYPEYVNERDGFLLTFPEKWEGYSYKDTTDTYYETTFYKKIGSTNEKVEFRIMARSGASDPSEGYKWMSGLIYQFAYYISDKPASAEAIEIWNQIPQILSSFDIQ